MGRPLKSTAPKVVESIKRELAAAKPGARGKITTIAKDHGVTPGIVKGIAQDKKKDIMELRARIAEQGFDLVERLDSRLVQALSDDDKMAATPLRDMAMAREKLVDSSVTAQEGHTPQVVQNFGFLKEGRAILERYDQTLLEKRAKARLVEGT